MGCGRCSRAWAPRWSPAACMRRASSSPTESPASSWSRRWTGRWEKHWPSLPPGYRDQFPDETDAPALRVSTRRVEHLAHLACQRVRCERLLEVRRPRLEDAVPDDRVVRVPGRVQHLHVRPYQRELLCQPPPTQHRHHHVRQEQVDRAAMLVCHVQRHVAVGRLEHRVPLALEHLLGDGADGRSVLDQENSLGPTRYADGPGGLYPLNGRVYPRQVNLEARAVPRL